MRIWTSYTKSEFHQLVQECREASAIPIDSDALFMYLMKIRTARTFADMGQFFRASDRTISSKVAKMRHTLSEVIVPKYLRYERSKEVLVSHKTAISVGLFDEDDPNRAHLIMDGTYIFIEKSKDHGSQKITYNSHKKRNYVKIMMGTAPDGEILFAEGPYPAVDNDAVITKKILENNIPVLRSFHVGDVAIVDRGFRDCVHDLMNNGFIVKMPVCSDHPQLTTHEANVSRFVTEVRFDVERLN